MRFSITAALFAGAAMVAADMDFLVRMHAQLITQPLEDDIMQVKVVAYEGGKATVVCRFGGQEFFSDSEDRFCAYGHEGIHDGFGCREGWMACAWDNGRQGLAKFERGDELGDWELKLANGGDVYNYDCAPCWQDRCTKCSDWESCLDNGKDNGDHGDCPTCEHKGNYVCLDGDHEGIY